MKNPFTPLFYAICASIILWAVVIGMAWITIQALRGVVFP